MKVTVNEQGALFIALGETMLNKNVSFDEAQKPDQRDYLVARINHYGVTLDRAREIADNGLKGLKVAPLQDDPEALHNGSIEADKGIPATSNNGAVINNANGTSQANTVNDPAPPADANKVTLEGQQEQTNPPAPAAEVKKEEAPAEAKKK